MIAPMEILVATDFGPASAAAVRYAREFARAFGSRVHVLHVIMDIVAGDVLPQAYGQEIGKAQAAMETGAREELRTFMAADAWPARVNVVEAVTASNAVAPAIIDYAEEHLVDLIIIGSHGRGGFAHRLLGSVADTVVRSAPCPVLTVRHPEREFVHPAPEETGLRA